ncbi:Alpha/Beta hydrolase protein [Phaeosphaeriaceae sp. PMI808]|nr:Alpha/Beta hydrolase protein [Phaeosphaeriaceae sp. PMI808]
MGAQPTERERKSRRKRSHTSTKSSKHRSSSRTSSVTPLPAEIYLQDFAPHAVSSHYLPPFQPKPTIANGPPRHPVYGQVPQILSPESDYESPSVQPVEHSANRSNVRFASPPAKQRDGGEVKEQSLGKINRMAAKSYTDLRNGATKSTTKLTNNYIERPSHAVAMKSMQALCHGAALYDVITSKFDNVINCIDGERFSGKEQDLLIYDDPQHKPSGSNHFSKVWLYSNSRLPPHQPPFKVYMPTYPLICLAATYSERVYTPPRAKSNETETHIPSDWRTGTKAMVLKSIPVDDMNTVVFAVRGSEGFMDWAVNYNTAPTTPDGFLEDASNLCHSGFLYVARKMIKPVADRLRVLLQENPSRSNCSLLITGHSAGGAVAALLYAHMMSTKIESELSYLTGFFKRVHCITFGAPPISLRALQRPDDKRHRKSLFYSFINEGDPVPRADKAFVKSLVKLYASPAPSVSALAGTISNMSKLNLAHPPASSPPQPRLKTRLTRPSKTSLQTVHSASTAASSAPAWTIPPCTLAPAGRLVVLRAKAGNPRTRGGEEVVEAVTVEEEMLRKVVYGDPLKHQMRTYRLRIESIATRAVTAGGY